MSASEITMLGINGATLGAIVTRSMTSIENFAARSASANFCLLAGGGAALLASLLTGAAFPFGNIVLVAGAQGEGEAVGGSTCDVASDAAMVALPPLPVWMALQ